MVHTSNVGFFIYYICYIFVILLYERAYTICNIDRNYLSGYNLYKKQPENPTGKSKMTKRVTREDVAREAGVSVAAVSRALNNSGYVKKEKRERIIEVADRLGYNPNPVAMSLQRQRSGQIIFFRKDLTGAYYNQMFHGIVREAQKRNYNVLLDMQYDFQKIPSLMIDGIIFPDEYIAEEYAKSIGHTYRLPTVTACYETAWTFSKPMPCVLLDDRRIIEMAVDYLKKMGHRRIGMAVPFESGYAKNRYVYWKDRMREEMKTDCMKYVIQVSDHPESVRDELDNYLTRADGFEYYDLFEAGRKAARQYISSHNPATAIICFNDDMAHGMIQELERLGTSVPEDVSIMGIDGTFIRNHFQKKLTSVATYPDRMGAKCVDSLLDMLEDKSYKYMNWGKISILEGETVAKL